MANDSYTQQALADDASFHGRVRASLGTVAWQVLDEEPTAPDHVARADYARFVLNDLPTHARRIAPWLVQRPNLFQFATSYDFQRGNVVTAAGDADIESQLATDWNDLAGIVPEAGTP